MPLTFCARHKSCPQTLGCIMITPSARLNQPPDVRRPLRGQRVLWNAVWKRGKSSLLQRSRYYPNQNISAPILKIRVQPIHDESVGYPWPSPTERAILLPRNNRYIFKAAPSNTPALLFFLKIATLGQTSFFPFMGSVHVNCPKALGGLLG